MVGARLVLVVGLVVLAACEKKDDAARADGVSGAKRGVRSENDPGLCTQRCAKECLSATDLAGIDACASRIANP